MKGMLTLLILAMGFVIYWQHDAAKAHASEISRLQAAHRAELRKYGKAIRGGDAKSRRMAALEQEVRFLKDRLARIPDQEGENTTLARQHSFKKTKGRRTARVYVR